MEGSLPPFLSPTPFQHEQLKEVYMSLPDEQTETSFPKTEHTDLAHYFSGHHPVLRRWQHLVGVSKNAVCLLLRSGTHLSMQSGTFCGMTPWKPWTLDGRTRPPSTSSSRTSMDNTQVPAVTTTSIPQVFVLHYPSNMAIL